MEHPADWAQETGRLQGILDQVRQQLQTALTESRAQQGQLAGDQRQMQVEADQDFGNLWSAQDFENLAAVNQYTQSLALDAKRHQATLERIGTLSRMADKPYFARLNLQYAGDEEPESVTIGRAALWGEKSHALLIHDWRSPVASLFYRFGLGDAAYDAPVGRVACRIALKRQYEIEGGALAYFFDADQVVQDRLLRDMLGRSASPQMKAIVETIQRDQDLAIRDEDSGLLMVQGVAGSGKTSIALHRVAYLMYEGVKDHLAAQDILILSPNDRFAAYIGGVLPELGQQSVTTLTFEAVLSECIGAPVSDRASRLDELFCAPPDQRERMRQALAYKCSAAFLHALDRLVEALPHRLPYRDLYYGGQVLLSAQQIKGAVLGRDRTLPLGAWLRRYEQLLWRRAEAARPARFARLRKRVRAAGLDDVWARAYSLWEFGVLARAIHAITRPDCRALYEGLTGRKGALDMQDGAAIAYLRLRLLGGTPYGHIRQVVVDEAQDYGMTDFGAMHLLFPRARFTVLGDVHQVMDRPVDLSLYRDVARALPRPGAKLIQLTKSFRCTREILEFSQSLFPVSIDSFNRGGEKPKLLPNAQIGAEIARCQALGHRSIALVAKTEADAAAWRAKLGLPSGEGQPFVIQLALAKGLEFDAVLVLDCDSAHYGWEDGALLYVACTRALHRLSLFWAGTLSPLLQGKEGIA